ncbi:hypothetical protein ACJJTC_008740 [Scirpophaga incertulas]
MKFIVFVFIIYLCEGVLLPSIPPHLIECYRGGGPDIRAPKRLDVYLSIIKKLEREFKLDMRMFSGSLIRSFRLDGIEESSNIIQSELILPFRATGFQFHRQKVFIDLFLPTQNLLDINGTLSVSELCQLHRMMSSSVRHWERGDENIVCPLSAEQRQNMATSSSGRVYSRCPIEEGVIQTQWGPIAPGTLVAAIAASLESQRVLVTDILNADIFKAGVSEPLMASAKQEWFENIEVFNVHQDTAPLDISNIWVATLAGDLAEVIVNQGPRVGSVPRNIVVGTNNRWNDTFLPRDFYLLPGNASNIDWHFTDAEIIAGIDAKLPQWIEQRRTLRLSQIIDMYYSHEGISFNSSVRACNRPALFNEIVRRETLLTETLRFAHVLSLRQITVYMPIEEIERISEAAVTAFFNYVPTLLNQYHADCHVSNSIPYVDLIVATDSSWSRYEVEQFISWIGGALEINLLGSSLALLHGNTGQWIAPPSSNLTSVFNHMANFTDSWPSRLNLPNIISRIIQFSRNKTLENAMLKTPFGPSTMVLIISPSDRLSDSDLIRASELMHSLRVSFFDVYFAYVARQMTDFQNLNNEYVDYSELFVAVTSSSVSDIIHEVDTYVVNNEIPTTLFGNLCPSNGSNFEQIEYEDNVLPNRKVNYRIHPFYLLEQDLVSVRIRNAGHGTLLACSWRGADASHTCHTIEERGTHIFNLTKPCTSHDFCLPAYFSVAASSSSNMCAHYDCRYPHQIDYYLEHVGIRCLPLRNSASIAKIKNILSYRDINNHY